MLHGSMCDVLWSVRLSAMFMAWATLRMERSLGETLSLGETFRSCLVISVWYLSRRHQIGKRLCRSGGEGEIWTRDDKLGGYQHIGHIFKPGDWKKLPREWIRQKREILSQILRKIIETKTYPESFRVQWPS